jgi:haloacetate dehalogenase
MFEGFKEETIEVGEIRVRARIGGDGPPLLLLHGNPQTHVMWHQVAPALAERFTVVAPDLRGYGLTSKPDSAPDHLPYSKRVMALDQVETMRLLGFDRFLVAGHDRGGRVGYRLALDHPGVVAKLAVLDIVPTYEAFERGGRMFALGQYHWFFLAQPAPLPEKLIGADPDWFWRWHTTRQPDTGFFDPEAVAEYLACFRDPETIRGICEDYRAGATIDFDHDKADKEAGRRIACPVLVLWGTKGTMERWYDPLRVWGEWAEAVSGGPIQSGHYLAEEAPEETARELLRFFTDVSDDLTDKIGV